MDFIFGNGISSVLSENLDIEYSKKTGKIKSFGINDRLVGTFRTDGGIALTIYGATLFIKQKYFLENCIVPIDDAVSFVSEGRSLFVKHVFSCGSNVKSGSDVAIIDKNESILAVGRSLFSFDYYTHNSNQLESGDNIASQIRGIGVKIREGIKSRSS
ncbi:PUA domain-containing protein [Candidatus Nitrosocosmicus hydrocola]|uniref:PUA domain-containing protein n=1 Tax=Candidatus Nitrosocosmicus hydrocola TaxID=1826872 RepID=UPI0013734F66|nr:PUA domain-containing protein [Candidatus Nitrosocosmicus hydrocola]